jgi:uncharacterized protein (TIGR04255 family)
MTQTGNVLIDLHREFPNLRGAPIAEAVIHWQASPGKALDREGLKTELERRFSGYTLHTQQHIEAEWNASAEGLESHQRTRWAGFRLTSLDEKHVCQVTPSSVIFSRLAPYEHWPTFVAEAIRFWDGFVELASPVSVDRLGVRFINKMEMSGGEKATDLIADSPDLLQSTGLRHETFFRQDLLEVPGHPYRASLVRAIQAAQPPVIPEKSLIVDIDVFTTEPTPMDKTLIEQRLEELRFLKNLVFFSFVRDPEKRFGGG